MARLSKRTYADRSVFNSLSELTLYGDFDDARVAQAADATWHDVCGLLRTVRARLSTNVEGSDVFRFNQARCGERVGVSAMTAALVRRAAQISSMTDGAFDPSVFPLVDLWGFSPRAFNHEPPLPMPYDRPAGEGEGYVPPDERYVKAFLHFVGMDEIVVEGDMDQGFYLVKLAESVEADGVEYQAAIDLGGIAKGFIADCVAQYMRSHGFERGCYSSASSIAVLRSGGSSPAVSDPDAFGLTITSPRLWQQEGAASQAGSAQQAGAASQAGSAPQAQAVPQPCAVDSFMQVRVRDRFLSTSGDYGRCHMFGDVRVSHEIDGRTGYPVNITPEMVGHGHGRGLAAPCEAAEALGAQGELGRRSTGICSLTLLGPSGVDCDALTTALTLMGPAGAVEFFNENLRHDHDLVMVLDGEGMGKADGDAGIGRGTRGTARSTRGTARGTHDVPGAPEDLLVVTSFASGDYRILDPRYHVVSSVDADGRVACNRD